MYIQTTLNTNTDTEKNLVPVFMFTNEQEVKELSKLILEVKPTYLINCSNSIDSLKNHVKRTVINNVVFLMNTETISEIEKDYTLRKHIKIINLFNGVDTYEY